MVTNASVRPLRGDSGGIIRDQLNLNLLKAFLLVAEERNFRAASERLHISHSAVSVQIKQLEHQVGVPLFIRTTRSVELTPEGAELLAGTQAMFSELHAILQKIRTADTAENGFVSMACTPAVASAYLVPAMSRYRNEYPHIKLNVREIPSTEIYRCLRDGLVDFGIGTRLEINGFDFELILDDPIVALVPRTLMPERQTAIPMEKLVTLPILLHSSMTNMRRNLEIAFQNLGVQLKARHLCENSSTLISLAEDGHGVAVIPLSSFAYPREELVQVLPIVSPSLTRPTAVITLAGKKLSPQAAKMAAIIADVIVKTARRASDAVNIIAP